ncbi:MAG: VOC family protein [Thermoplasmata archaeon]
MASRRRPGRKPHRLYLRVARRDTGGADVPVPPARAIEAFVQGLERTGRLIAQGPLTDPTGDFLLFRASDAAEARRAMRPDPFLAMPRWTYAIWEWDPRVAGTGVNLEPAPSRGSGRLTHLDRVSLFVRDREVAKRWYQEVLGIPVRTDERPAGALEVSLGPGATALSLAVPVPAWGRESYEEARDRIGRPTGLVFRTDSIRALALRLEHAHAPITSPPRREPWGEWTLRFADPDGNEFLACGPEGTGSDRHEAAGTNRPARPR